MGTRSSKNPYPYVVAFQETNDDGLWGGGGTTLHTSRDTLDDARMSAQRLAETFPDKTICILAVMEIYSHKGIIDD